jgi:CPA2 family monovalent cation:H+ antiporter-2
MNPTMRIVVRTRYIAETEALMEAGVDRVIAEELESIVQLFAEVLRDYRISAEEIEAHEEAVRRGGYQALLKEPVTGEKPVVECDIPEECFDTRSVIVRSGAPVTSRTLSELDVERRYGIRLNSVKRDGKAMELQSGDLILRPGDELALSGTAASFGRSAFLFRTGEPAQLDEIERTTPSSQANAGSVIDTEQVIELRPSAAASDSCSHLDQVNPVMPSARGCEECLRMGDTWVHLRICMTCGHVGCCDTSRNKHASKHFPETSHPIIKSLQPGEDWAWCYADETYL